MEQQPFTGLDTQTKDAKPKQKDNNKTSQRAFKFGVIDHKILKHSLRSVIRNKFSIVWFSVWGAINLLMLIIFAFIPAFTTTKLYEATLIWFITFGATQMIYNLVSLNKIFSMDDEIGIVSLETRKGRGPAMVFFSRLLGQKIIVWSFMLIYMALLLIACSLNNHLLLQTKYVFVLAWFPIDLILTGIFLLFFSFKRYRLAVGIGSVLIALVLATPLADMVNMLVTYSDEALQESFQEDGNLKTYLADEMYQIINESDNKDNNFVYQLMNEVNSNTLSSYLKAVPGNDYEEGDLDPSYVEDAIAGMTYQGVFVDDSLFGEDGVLQYAIANDTSDVYFDKVDDSAFTQSVLYQINTEYMKKNHTTKTDYTKSYYSDLLPVSQSQYKYTLGQLQNVIDYINNSPKFNKLSGVKELNKMIYEYASYFPEVSSSWENELRISTQPINTIYDFTDDAYNTNDGVNSFVEKTEYQTPSGLRLWNQVVMQFIGNALTFENPTDFTRPSKYQNYARLDPWGMSFWSMMGGQDSSSPLFKIAVSYIGAANFNYGTLYNYSRWTNSNATSEDKVSLPTFDASNMRKAPVIKGVSYKTTGHSSTGYNIFISFLGMGLIGLAYVLYRLRLRRQ